MYCVNCGKKIENNSSFCTGCGAKLITKEAKSKIKDVSKKVVNEAVKTGAKSVKKSLSTGWKLTIFSSIVAGLLAIANYYFAYIVESPDDVIKSFMTAVDKQDVNGIVESLDPSFQKEYKVAKELTGGLLNYLTGTGLDYSSLMDISSEFYEYIYKDHEKCNATNFKVIKYEGEKLGVFVSKFGNKIPAIGNALGSSAVVEFEVDNKDVCNSKDLKSKESGNKLIYQIEVRKYDEYGWKIPSEILASEN